MRSRDKFPKNWRYPYSSRDVDALENVFPLFSMLIFVLNFKFKPLLHRTTKYLITYVVFKRLNRLIIDTEKRIV